MTNEELDENKVNTEETAETSQEQNDDTKQSEGTKETDAVTENAPEEKTADDGEAEKVAKELASVKDQLLRTMAEYDNFRQRSAREKDALRAEIITDVTSKFLPVLDNLERALANECSDDNYKKGVEMISNSFCDTLKNLGVEEIESDGAQFNPNLHQAVQRIEDSDAESGTVVQTFAKGYKIGDKVIRFAMVAVAN